MGCIHRGMDACMHGELTDLKMDTWMHARMNIKMDDNSVGQWLSEWMGGCMDAWMDG